MSARPAMHIRPDALQFLVEMVEQLDESIRSLVKRERELVSLLGSLRVEELKELRDQTLDREDELALRFSLDWRDKELLWVWSRQRRAYATRASAGQSMMRGGSLA